MHDYRVPTLGALIADLAGRLFAHVAAGEFPLSDWISITGSLHAEAWAVA